MEREPMANNQASAVHQRTTSKMTKAERVAASLTPAQRLAMRSAWQASWGGWYVPTNTRWDVRHRLIEKGLCSRRPGMPLNALGVEVHDHLLAQGAD
jgi:hypothetical protein